MRNRIKLKLWIGLGLTFILILTTLSCQRTVRKVDTIVRKGVLYQKGKKEPFTGIVVGKGRDDYRRTVCTFEKAYEKGLQHGLTVYWYENGKVESKETYVKGEIHGVVMRYYRSGMPKACFHFEHGLRGGGNGEMFWDDKDRKTKG